MLIKKEIGTGKQFLNYAKLEMEIIPRNIRKNLKWLKQGFRLFGELT